MEKLFKAIDELIGCIENSKEYLLCVTLKNQMKENSTIMDLMNQVKKKQKEYIRSGYDSNLKKQLDEVYERLHCVPIYHIYEENLEKVNEMINYMQDSLNDYFDQLLNK